MSVEKPWVRDRDAQVRYYLGRVATTVQDYIELGFYCSESMVGENESAKEVLDWVLAVR